MNFSMSKLILLVGTLSCMIGGFFAEGQAVHTLAICAVACFVGNLVIMTIEDAVLTTSQQLANNQKTILENIRRLNHEHTILSWSSHIL